jgi:tRNA-dihydrouridine synthase A
MLDDSQKRAKIGQWRFCVAPMMEWTDRHCRFFHRLLTRRAVLYTEMITTGAVIHGDRERLLGFDAFEHPIALQLGGADPRQLAESARIGEGFGYREINLNVGCPSDRVQEGRFGAYLMAEPALVAEGLTAMKAAVAIAVTVKCRIGIDDQDPEQSLDAFTQKVKAAGADALIVHARKAWLDGLSPRENRDIPPLDYDRVYRLKRANPGLEIVINGGIGTIDDATNHLRHVDGVMMGRAAYQEPYRLLAVDPALFGETAPSPSMKDVGLVPRGAGRARFPASSVDPCCQARRRHRCPARCAGAGCGHACGFDAHRSGMTFAPGWAGFRSGECSEFLRVSLQCSPP